MDKSALVGSKGQKKKKREEQKKNHPQPDLRNPANLLELLGRQTSMSHTRWENAVCPCNVLPCDREARHIRERKKEEEKRNQ